VANPGPLSITNTGGSGAAGGTTALADLANTNLDETAVIDHKISMQ